MENKVHLWGRDSLILNGCQKKKKKKKTPCGFNHNKVTKTEFKVQFEFLIANFTVNNSFCHQEVFGFFFRIAIFFLLQVVFSASVL